jgi:large subunit ribosomal protein L10
MTKHLKAWRIEELKIISDIISKYKTIGIGDLNNFPAALLHRLRKNASDIFFKVTNRKILKMALEKLNQKDVAEKLPAQPILILSNDNAFNIYAAIKKNKAKSKAKVGMVSPKEIIIPEGDTGLAPGPALSDLKKVGIKAQVKGATIHVTKDTVIAKEGDIINENIVSTLSKLDIKPIELILDVVFIKEDGVIYNKEVLDVDTETIYNNFITAVRQAINLGVVAGYATDMTIEPMIVMAELQAKSLEKEVEEKGN